MKTVQEAKKQVLDERKRVWKVFPPAKDWREAIYRRIAEVKNDKKN